MNKVPKSRIGDSHRHKSFQEYIAVLYRGRWMLLSMVMVGLGISLLQAILAEKRYKATSAIVIDERRAQGLEFLDATSAISSTNTLQNELQVLRSYAVARAIAETLFAVRYLDSATHDPIRIISRSDDKPGSLTTLEQTIQRLLDNVSFEEVRLADVIRITAESPEPREAALIANLYAQSYRDQNVTASRARSRKLREFLEDQKREKEIALRRAEDALLRYMEDRGVVSLDEESRGLINQLSGLEAERDATRIEIQTLTTTLKELGAQLAQQEQDVAKVMGEANDPYIRLLQDQLAQLEVQLDITLSQSPTTVNADIVNEKTTTLREQIATLRAQLQKRIGEYLGTVLPSSQEGSERGGATSYLGTIKQRVLETQLRIQALTSKEQALQGAIGRYESQFRSVPVKSLEYARLQREKAGLERLYLMLDQKHSEANITEQSIFGYVDIFDEAIIPEKPSSPNLIANLVIGFFLGCMIGLGLVFARESFRQLVQTPEDVERIGLACLSTVRDLNVELRRTRDRKGAVATKKAFDPHLIVITRPTSPASEAYRHLYATMRIAPRAKPIQAVFVTSPEQGDGKTTTVSNLALAFAEAGERVLLLETDVHRPAIRRAFDARSRPGLYELLVGKATTAEVLQKSGIPNLHLITSGDFPAERSRVLGSDEMRSIIVGFKRDFDVVLLDSAPVLALTDALILAPVADLIVMVASSGKTSVAALRKAVHLLGTVGATPAGVVLNKFDERRGYGLHYDHQSIAYYGYGYRVPVSDGNAGV